MKVALIRLNLQKKEPDGKLAFRAAVVMQTNIKTAIQYKPDSDDLLALSENKFRIQFPHRKFPIDLKTTDGQLVQWIKAIKAPKEPTKEGVKKNVSLFGVYVLVDAITISRDPDGKQINSIAAIGDSVYVRCDNASDVQLPKPVILLEAANHYILHQYCILPDNEFKTIAKNNYGTPWTTANNVLSSVKATIEQTNQNSLKKPPIKSDDILKRADRANSITSGPAKHYGTILPTGAIKFLKKESAKRHIPVTRILIDCILAKYGQN